MISSWPIRRNARIQVTRPSPENIFRAVNIALINELKVVYDPMGIDVCEVIEAARTKPFGFMPFYPGPGLGGHCIPIDPFYLAWKARAFGVSTRFIELTGEVNTLMPCFVVDRIALAVDRQSGRGLRSVGLGTGMLAGCAPSALGRACSRASTRLSW